MPERPNLFDFATSELSQDAFICWLLSRGDSVFRDTHPQLNACASDLFRAFFEKHSMECPPDIQSIVVSQYYEGVIDVACIVNGTFAILILEKPSCVQCAVSFKQWLSKNLNWVGCRSQYRFKERASLFGCLAVLRPFFSFSLPQTLYVLPPVPEWLKNRGEEDVAI